MSEEEQDDGGGAAIPPPAKRKVRERRHARSFYAMIAFNLCPGIVIDYHHCRESGFVSTHHLKRRLP